MTPCAKAVSAAPSRRDGKRMEWSMGDLAAICVKSTLARNNP